MYLPDKIIIDLYQVDLVVDKISKILKQIMKITACGPAIDVGNDLDYALKDLTSFKKKLINLISKEAKKYQTDIFGNVIQSLNNYRYVELMFSEDYREITSVRLFGEAAGGSYNRYSIFNLPNKFDATTIMMLYNSEEIIQNYKNITEEELKYIEFLQDYFTPFPLLHPIRQKDLKCLDNASKQYDDGKEKTFEEVKEQTKKFESIDFKKPIFDVRELSFSKVDGLTFVLPEIELILKKLETFEEADDPGAIINVIQSTIFDKFKISDITGFVFDGLNLQIDPFKSLTDSEPVSIMEKIDNLPEKERQKIYQILKDPNGPVNLGKIMVDLQEFINFKLNLENIDLDLSKLLNGILLDLENIKIPEVLIELANLKLPDTTSRSPNFEASLPEISNKINKIKLKIDNWIIKLREITNIFNTDPTLANIPENGQIKNKLQENIRDLEDFKIKLNNISFDPNFNVKLLEAYNFAVNIKLPELYFNLDQFINKKVKKKNCKFKIPKIRPNLKITNLFKKIKLKFPKIFLDFKARFNLIFPKFDFLEELRKVFNLDIFNNQIPNVELPLIELPKFKIPDFNIEISDLFGDFSDLIDFSILKTMSSILSQITKILLELLNLLNKLDDFAFENMFPLPEINVSNPNIPKYQLAFNEEWLIYIEYVYRLLIETDKLRTEPQVIKLPDSMVTNPGIRDKIKNKMVLKPIENCEPRLIQPPSTVTKREMKRRKIENIQDALAISDIDSLLEKIKNYQFSDIHDYFRTENTDEDLIIDILRFIAKSLKDTPNQIKPKLPVSSVELIKKTSDMVEQIEAILDQREMNSLLNGTYSEETAEIVRNIAKINFPDLTYKVDPIKYFRMLGKVIGSKNNPKFGYKEALSGVGIKK